MFLSRTMTAPTCFRSQVARVATSTAIRMKYWSQETRSRGLMVGFAKLHLTTCGRHGLVRRVTRISRRMGTVAAASILAIGAALVPMAVGQTLSDKATAEQILAEVTRAPAGSSADPAVTRTPIDEAKRALDRAAGARRSGDVRHAEMLEG